MLLISPRHKFFLQLQRALAYVNMIWFVPLFMLLLHGLGRYHCVNLRQLRQKARKLASIHPNRPILICSNHLTMIDSLLIIWFLNDFPSYIRSFQLFPWNVPELQNFGKNFLLRLMCYLGKCVYVERSGSLETKRQTLAKLDFLIERGESLCIFPEGGRSRSGRIDRNSAVYGVGQLIQAHPELKVWCLYLRGEGQDSYSFLPKRGERFYADLVEIRPETSYSGRRAARDLTMQVIDQLAKMEEAYFHDRQRHRRHG